MPSLYPRRSGYQTGTRAFIGPVLPGTLRGKDSDGNVFDAIFATQSEPDMRWAKKSSVYAVFDENHTLIAHGVSHGQALAIRGAQRLLFEKPVHIFEISDEIASKFSHQLSDFFVHHSPENDAPPPAPPEHDWRAASRKAKAIRNFIHTTVVEETTISGRINPDRHGQMKDYSKQPGYSVIDVRTLRVLYSAEDVASATSYITQQVARRGNHVYDYRVIAYRDRLLYTARVRVLGFRLTYLGKTICVGNKADITTYITTRRLVNNPHIMANLKVERF